MPKNCPYCAEILRDEARICPFCRSPLTETSPLEAYRDHPERQLAGVAAGLARSLGISVTFLRLLFIIFTFASFVAPFVYAALWLLMPFEAGGTSPLGRLVGKLEGLDEREGDPSLLERGIHWARRQLSKLQTWFDSRKQSRSRSTEGTP